MLSPKRHRFADLGAAEAAGEVGVAEQHELDRAAQPEGDDRQVDPARSHRRQPEQDPERDRRDDPDQAADQEGHVGGRQQSPADPGAEAGEGELRQRELARVAGEDDDR